MFPEVFFLFSFRTLYSWRNKAQRKEKRWSSYAVSVRMSIARLTVAWLAGAKVDDISMQSKYIYHFFYSFLKQFRKWLIDKDVVEHNSERKDERRGKGIHYYIYVREMCAWTEAGKSTERTLKLRIGGIKLRFENLELRFSEVKLRFIFAELRYGFVMMKLVHLVQRFTGSFSSHTRARIIKVWIPTTQPPPPIIPHRLSDFV